MKIKQKIIYSNLTEEEKEDEEYGKYKKFDFVSSAIKFNPKAYIKKNKKVTLVLKDGIL